MSQLDIHRGPEHKLRLPEDFLDPSVNEAIERTVRNIREFLGRHVDLIPADKIDQIVRREREALIKEPLALRQAGRANEQACSEPGIRVYLTAKGKEHVIERFVDEKISIPENSWQRVGDNAWLLKLPRGTYRAGGGGIRFCVDFETTPGKQGANDQVRATQPFGAFYGDVMRIEGESSGALWQNERYNWNLLPKD